MWRPLAPDGPYFYHYLFFPMKHHVAAIGPDGPGGGGQLC